MVVFFKFRNWILKMAITKEKKQSLITEYVKDLQEANNLVLIKQSGLPVTADTDVRRCVREWDGKYNVVRKRLFLRALKEAGYPQIDLDQMPGSAVAVYAKWDEYAPLKAVNKYLKIFQKVKDGKASFEFLWGRFNKEWKDAAYVTELANIPSREELLSKLVWLFNYPVQSFTSVLDQIAKKKNGWSEVESKVEEKIEESKAEEVVEETAKETPSEVAPEVAEEIIEDSSETKTE